MAIRINAGEGISVFDNVSLLKEIESFDLSILRDG